MTDPTTAGAFVAAVLPPLEADAARRFPHADPHLVTEAAGTAVIALLRRPDAYDPVRSPLPKYLRMIAQRDLVNLLDREGKHRRGRIPWECVELGLPARNEEEEPLSLADSPAVQAAVAGLSDADRLVFELMLDGERETAVFAAALGLTHVPPDEQAAAVKRAKDRVKARLRRAAEGKP